MMQILVRAAALALMTAAPARAHAASPAYVGTWGANPAQCRVGQEMEDAPLIMKVKRYDQHEVHCTFASVRKSGAAWKTKAKCQAEGSMQNINLTLSVKDDQLTIRDGMGARVLQRCS